MFRSIRRQNKEGGSVIVEFALATLTILLVLFLIVDLGRALYAYDWVSDAARQGTRFAMVRGVLCDPLLGPVCSNAPYGAQAADVTTYVNSLAIGVDPGQVTVNTRCQVGGTVFVPPPCAEHAWVQVEVLYDFHFISPLFPALSWTMHSVSRRPVQD